MEKTNVSNVESVLLKKDDKILFDCNVLMYLFYTYGGYKKDMVRKYTKIFSDALKTQCQMYIPSIEISEFINTYSRLEYNRYLRKNNLRASEFKFKQDYRATKDYKELVVDLRNLVNNQILSVFKKLNDEFENINIENIYHNPELFDFNDRYYCKLAEKYGLKIVTNDADFSVIGSGIHIITANTQLISA